MHFEAEAFSWTHREPHEAYLESYIVPEKPWKSRKRCKTCGAQIASYNSKTGRWSVWAASLERDGEGRIKRWDLVKPTAHQFYGTRVLNVDDELGKWDGYENESTRLDLR